jgi:hypothetical protein
VGMKNRFDVDPADGGTYLSEGFARCVHTSITSLAGDL